MSNGRTFRRRHARTTARHREHCADCSANASCDACGGRVVVEHLHCPHGGVAENVLRCARCGTELHEFGGMSVTVYAGLV